MKTTHTLISVTVKTTQGDLYHHGALASMTTPEQAIEAAKRIACIAYGCPPSAIKSVTMKLKKI